jgi:hypothetical protein
VFGSRAPIVSRSYSCTTSRAIRGAGDEQQSEAVIYFGVDCSYPVLNCDGRIYNQDLIDHGAGVVSVINGNNRDSTDFSCVA